MSDHDDFRQLVESWELRHFSPDEFLVHVGDVRKGQRCEFPPKKLWKNLKAVALVVDELRHRLGVPVTISSAYRSDGYNWAVGGVRGSQHKEFKALDVKAKGVRPKKVADTLVQMRAEGLFRGGVGRYKTFTHVDTRGHNVGWGRN